MPKLVFDPNLKEEEGWWYTTLFQGTGRLGMSTKEGLLSELYWSMDHKFRKILLNPEEYTPYMQKLATDALGYGFAFMTGADNPLNVGSFKLELVPNNPLA